MVMKVCVMRGLEVGTARWWLGFADITTLFHLLPCREGGLYSKYPHLFHIRCVSSGSCCTYCGGGGNSDGSSSNSGYFNSYWLE